MIEVILYSREGCKLCVEAEALLHDLRGTYPHKLTVVDINLVPVLVERYGTKIPIIEVGPYHIEAPFDQQQLIMTLSAAKDRLSEKENGEKLPVSPKPYTLTTADKISMWFTKHYMLPFNLFIMLYIGLPFLAPVLMKTGATIPAAIIYRGYSFMCHQLAFRSYFLFGEQIVYPRQAAGVNDLLSYEQATGLNSYEFFKARNYIGDEHLGYKVALCERDVAIYAGILLFGIIFSLSGRRFPILPWWAWILFGIAPIGFDGVSQLISQLNISYLNQIIPFRESTPLLRTVTGGLFGILTAWFAYPIVELSMKDTQKMLAVKFSRVIDADPSIHIS